MITMPVAADRRYRRHLRLAGRLVTIRGRGAALSVTARPSRLIGRSASRLLSVGDTATARPSARPRYPWCHRLVTVLVDVTAAHYRSLPRLGAVRYLPFDDAHCTHAAGIF